MKRIWVFLAVLVLFAGSGCKHAGNSSVSKLTPQLSVPAATPTTAISEPSVTPKPEKQLPVRETDGTEPYYLPVFELNTRDGKGIYTKDEWLEATLTLSVYDEEKQSYERTETYSCVYKGRGNSSWEADKKPFNIKFEKKVSLLGLPKAKKYSVLANYYDVSEMRNYVTYYIANILTKSNYKDGEVIPENYLGTGWKWSPKGEYAEFYIDGEYAGLFLVSESVQISKNRLDLKEQNEEHSIPIDELGYLFELSINGDNHWWTTKYLDRINMRGRGAKDFKGIPFTVKDPDYEKDLSEEEQKYVQQYISEIEDILFAEPSEEAWANIRNAVDVTSFADYWLVQALANNFEMIYIRSVFVYKDNGILYAGPIWDFDMGTYDEKAGNPYWQDVFYYAALFAYPEFGRVLKERWEYLRPYIETEVPELVEQTEKRIGMALYRNDCLYKWEKALLADGSVFPPMQAARIWGGWINSFLNTRISVIDDQIVVDCP